MKRPRFGLLAGGKARWCSGCGKGHDGAVDLVGKKCEDCGLKQPRLGLPSEGKLRWCVGCGKLHLGAVNLADMKCEDCQGKQPTFGLPAEGKKRWCSDCGKGHAGASYVSGKKCEGCQLKRPTFGMLADGKVRWCSGCAQGHVGAMNITHKKCEGCRKRPTFALPAEGKERWCAGCAKGHVGAVDVVHTNCEVCGKKQARHALPSDEKKRRWCGDCAPKAALPRQKPVAWEAQLALLAGYKAAHGDCSVPRGWAEDKQLATWVMTQRKLKRDLDRGLPSGRMTVAWAARLTTLGFVWDTAAARAEAVKEAHTTAKATKVVEEAKAAAAAKDRGTCAIFRDMGMLAVAQPGLFAGARAGGRAARVVAAAAASNRSAAPRIAVLADLAGLAAADSATD